MRINAPDQRSGLMEAVAERYVQRAEFSGVAWQVTHRGDTISHGAAGYSSYEQKTELREDAIFRIYSMTKPLVSVLALQCVEAGLLRLYDPVANYLPGFGAKGVWQGGPESGCQPLRRPITIEDLLTHRAGLSYDFLPGCPVAQLYRDAALAADASRSLADMVSLMGDMPLARQPGTEWYYSYSIDVLARVLEVVTDTLLPELLQSNLLNPLGMRETAFDVAETNTDRLVSIYGSRDLSQAMTDPVVPQILNPMDVEIGYPSAPGTGFARGGHGLFSTLADYAAFLPVLMSGKSATGEVLLSKAMVDMMWHNRIPQQQLPLKIGPNAINGYGWNLFGRVLIDPGKAMVLSGAGEGGWAGAASTYFWVDRDADFCGIIMSQYLGASAPMIDDLQTAAYQMMN